MPSILHWRPLPYPLFRPRSPIPASLACFYLLIALIAGQLPAASARAEGSDCQRVVISADPAYPPLHWFDGKSFHGVSIDIATQVLADLGIPYELRYVGPFSRVLESARRGAVDMIATLKDTPERRAFLAYVPTAALENPIAVFIARRRPFSYHGQQDLVGKRGGIARNNQFGGSFDAYMHQHLTIEEADNLGQNLHKLESARIDYAVTGLYPGLAWIAANHKESVLQALDPPLEKTDNYVAFSRASPCLKYLEAFDRRLSELKQSGHFTKAPRVNLAIWRIHPFAVDSQ
jgi:polar amino acid transport system substrate-binding protein